MPKQQMHSKRKGHTGNIDLQNGGGDTGSVSRIDFRATFRGATEASSLPRRESMKVRILALTAMATMAALLFGMRAAQADPPGVPFNCFAAGLGANSGYAVCAGGPGHQ